MCCSTGAWRARLSQERWCSCTLSSSEDLLQVAWLRRPAQQQALHACTVRGNWLVESSVLSTSMQMGHDTHTHTPLLTAASQISS